MKLHCPHCGVKGSADDSYYGKIVKCPKCHEKFIATEAVADRRQEELTDEPALPVDDLREEHSTPAEIGSPGEGEPPPEASLEEESDEGYEETPVHAPDEGPVVEREEVLDWSDIVAEIDSESADEERDKKDREEASADFADLFAEIPAEELDVPEAEGRTGAESEREIDETAAVGSGDDRLPEMDEPSEPPVSISPVKADREEEALVESVKSEEIQEGSLTDHSTESLQLHEVESQPYGLVKEQCWQCGKKDSVGVPFIAKDGRFYCPDCVPVAEPETDLKDQTFVEPPEDAALSDGRAVAGGPSHRFTIGGAIREAWEKTKGAKGTIWAGSAVMYLAILVLLAGGAFLLPLIGYKSPTDTDVTGRIGNFLFQAVTDIVSMLFSAGLLFMGIRKVAGNAISWKMIFTGFSVAGRIIAVTILQTILVFIGFLVLVLPGIYLAIGYSMSIPLIVDRKMSPWQAMEASRKAIHKVWWKVAGLYLAMGVLFIISMVPLGIGLIWTWPMFIILAGVVYQYLFGVEKQVG